MMKLNEKQATMISIRFELDETYYSESY